VVDSVLVGQAVDALRDADDHRDQHEQPDRTGRVQREQQPAGDELGDAAADQLAAHAPAAAGEHGRHDRHGEHRQQHQAGRGRAEPAAVLQPLRVAVHLPTTGWPVAVAR
jgi:hypothetical protein